MTDADYRYRAATLEGQVVEGVVQGVSQRAALEELQRQQLYPIDVEPVARSRGGERRGRMGRTAALALFARTVATMLGAGVPLDRAIAFAANQARHPALASAAGQLHKDLEGGAGLAEAMGRHPRVFGSVFIAMAAAGEESGALDESMTRVADHLDGVVELQSRIRASLLYPMLMAVASGVGTIILLLFVVPRFVAMLDQADAALPVATRLLVGVSRLLTGGWWALLLLGLALALGTRSWLARPENRRRWHAWRLTLPLAGELEAKLATARFSRVLGMLLRSGRPVLPALRVARSAVANTAIGQDLDRAAESVSHGKPLNAALAGTLPPLAAELIAVGEETGRLDELCLRIADSYEDELKRSLRTLVAIIEPVLILLFGLLVGFVALAMLQAIYGLNVNQL
jgi:type II secretory pathway component PulF